MKEHSNKSENKGRETYSVALWSSQMPGQPTRYKAATATNESSILSEKAKDQSLHSVTIGTIDTFEGEVCVEAPSDLPQLRFS